MNTEQILKVLKNERECIARQSRPLGEMPQCRKDDDGVKLCEYCDLCLPDTEILEVYDFLIHGYELIERQGADSYALRVDIPEDKKDDLLEKLQSASTGHLMLMRDDKFFEPTPLPDDMIVQHEDDINNNIGGTV